MKDVKLLRMIQSGGGGGEGAVPYMLIMSFAAQ